MFKELFGSYLIESRKITKEQFTSLKNAMSSMRVKLGIIAVSEKFITEKQAEEINRAQAAMDKRFGDIAVEKGYLTDDQVGHLLSMQGNPYMQFVQAITEAGILTLEEVENAVLDYQQKNNFSDSDIDDIKSGDIDKITSIFVNSDSSMANELLSLAVRNIIRFISTEVSINTVEEISTYEFEHIAYQEVIGDHKILLGFSGSGTNLLSIANIYAKEEFEAIDEDSYDSVCEFINCINGLYASKLSNEDIDIDMVPPLFCDNSKMDAAKIFKLSITILGTSVDLIAVIDDCVTIA